MGHKVERLLRKYVRAILHEKAEILGEPDFPDEEEEKDHKGDKEDKEQEEASSVAGVVTPLGTGPTYPDEPGDRRRSPAAAAGGAFGNAKPYKYPKKKER